MLSTLKMVNNGRVKSRDLMTKALPAGNSLCTYEMSAGGTAIRVVYTIQIVR
jgi:hypothetical protein